MKTKRSISLIAIMLCIVACINPFASRKHKWLPTESSPLLYLMNIYQGDLILEDGNSIYIPCSGVSHIGWGN